MTSIESRKRHDPGDEGNLLAGQTVGVARAVPSLVVAAYGRPYLLQERKRLQQGVAHDRVCLDHGALVGGQRARLAQDHIGDADLPDVVQDGAELDDLQLCLR